MESLEDIKKKKLQEMLNQQNQQGEEQAQVQQQIRQLELLIGNYLSKDALLRYGNLKAAHTEKAMQLLVMLSQMIQQGQINGKVDDETLKKLIIQITPKQKDIKIKRV